MMNLGFVISKKILILLYFTYTSNQDNLHYLSQECEGYYIQEIIIHCRSLHCIFLRAYREVNTKMLYKYYIPVILAVLCRGDSGSKSPQSITKLSSLSLAESEQ